jgi:very-short-patch-repair endonuclease/predicted transcriptional regulator of viral defense system
MKPGPTGNTDSVILRLATEQHGIVTRRQLRSAGVSPHVLDHRVKAGLLHAVHAGVYRLGPVVAPLAREMAAVLACPGAAVSHSTAAGLWGLLPQRPADPVHVTLRPDQHRGRRPGLLAHRSELAVDEVAQLERVPVTTPARTLVDLARTVSSRELERSLARADRLRLVRSAELASLLDRHAGRAGSGRLRRLLSRDTLPAHTRSDIEERLLALIRSSGLPEPDLNVSLHGIEVDCFWRAARLAVEVDGYAYHSSVGAFIRDRQRDAALAAAGIQVLRLSWHQIVREREKTLVQLAQALARAG